MLSVGTPACGLWIGRLDCAPILSILLGLFLVTCVGTPVTAGSLSCLCPCSTRVAGDCVVVCLPVLLHCWQLHDRHSFCITWCVLFFDSSQHLFIMQYFYLCNLIFSKSVLPHMCVGSKTSFILAIIRVFF